METKTRSVTQMAASAGSSLCLSQYEKGQTGLICFCFGSGTLAGTARQPVPLRAGMAAVYPAWQPHRLFIETDARILICVFSAAGMEELPGARLAEPGSYKTHLEIASRRMEQILDDICLGELPAQLAEDAGAEPAGIPLYVRSARRIMDSSYDLPLTLDELSARTGRSKYHLTRAFRKYYHITPGAYLALIRLERAKELLENTALPVYEIGQQVGFPNSAYFATLFRQRFGCSPTEFRLRRKTPRP